MEGSVAREITAVEVAVGLEEGGGGNGEKGETREVGREIKGGWSHESPK